MTPSLWPQSPVPATSGTAWQWRVSSLARLRDLRAELRAHLRSDGHEGNHEGNDDTAIDDRILLAVDELASNGLRHGVPPVTVRVLATERGWLIIVSDGATERLPEPAVDRDRAHGGMGLYLVAELTTGHGWSVDHGGKHVWAWVAARADAVSGS